MNESNCANGHGPMSRIPGYWVLAGVSEVRPNALLPPGTARSSLTPTGEGLALTAWRCPTCGLVSLYDRTE